MIKGILFDLDGVIVDTAVFHFQAWQKMANELGFSINAEVNEKLKGISRMDSIAVILEHGQLKLSEKEILSLAAKKNKDYVEMVDKMTEKHLLPGILDLIDQLKDLNIKIALGSASKNARRILDRVALLEKFDALIDGNSVRKSKPDPEVFLKGAEALKLRNDECLVIEDAYAGIEAAHAAGMKAIGIGDKANLPNADLILPSFQGVQFGDLLKSLY